MLLVVSFVTLVILASLVIHTANAVTFTDHTGYVPDWARSMGNNQALAICTSSSVTYGTQDYDWCKEFAGYLLDQISTNSGESDNNSMNNNSVGDLQANIHYHNENLFLSPDLGKSNSFQDSQKRFSINVPSSWMFESSEVQNTNMIEHLGSFYTGTSPNQSILDITRMLVTYTDNKQWDSWTDSRLQEDSTVFSFISNPNGITIEHYLDVIKVTITGIEPPVVTNNPVYEKVTFFYIKNTDIRYTITYSAFSQIDYDRYIHEADKAINSIYIYEIPKIIPEFPFAIPIFVISLTSLLIFYRIKFKL